jgi:nucleotide-binding universal stress UspA family protein
MSFADILLRVVPTEDDELDRLALAVDLTQRLHARLDGLYVAGEGDNDANWARTLFERAVSKTSLETTWRVVDGASNAALLFQARRADLTILPRGAASRADERYAPATVALECGRPVLMLPQAANAMSIGHTVLVGWNESRESARALHDAMPILVNADRVVVATVADDELEPLADRRLVEHLRQHGVAVEVRRRHGDAADEIAAEARELGADMVVIGLHREGDPGSALGEVSQRFMRTATLPVFCSH